MSKDIFLDWRVELQKLCWTHYFRKFAGFYYTNFSSQRNKTKCFLLRVIFEKIQFLETIISPNSYNGGKLALITVYLVFFKYTLGNSIFEFSNLGSRSIIFLIRRGVELLGPKTKFVWFPNRNLEYLMIESQRLHISS